MLNKIKKILITILIKFKEKKFCEYKRLKYILFKNNSDTLVVVFSGFPREGCKAGYNYMRTLKNVKINKLFILDDFGYGDRGSYYLGEDNGQILIEKIIKLIDEIKNKQFIKNIYCVGSSKGGWASLFYGLKINANYIICGSPQYYLGNYLTLNDKHKNIMESIVGEINKENISFLNQLLKREILEKKSHAKILLHYSINEESYNTDVKFLLNDLKENGYKLIEDKAYYKEHSEVAVYFPETLKKYINKL